MSHLLDENDELLAPAGRELTLSTGAILGVFVGLALLCGLFFGFGYNVGHKSGASAALQAGNTESASPAASSGPPSDAFSGFKPSPNSTGSTARNTSAIPVGAPTGALEEHPVGAAQELPRVDVAQKPALPKPTLALAKPVEAAPALSLPTSQTASAAASGNFFVQVAAVSHPEDAALLLGALRARGYTVAGRSESGDKLIHVQVGPFPSKPTAEAMRQRLQTDGYNAIIK